MKVLYLYSGTRKEKIEKIKVKHYPDTQLYGFNYLEELGVRAEVKEFSDLIKNKLVNELFGFRIKHFLSFFLTRKYNVVFGSSLLYMMIWKKLFRGRTKFILLNISLNRTLAESEKKFIKFRIINWLLKEIDLIVCLSSYQRTQLMNRFHINKDKLAFVPLGVDTKFYKPIYNNRKDYILSVGRDNGRDYQTVINVAKKMSDRNFVIICSPRNLKTIKIIPKNVKVIFDLPVNELKKKYLEARALLLTTHPDGYLDGSDCSGQTVLLDAFASGLPVIATQKRYLNDYAENGKSVLLVEPYNVNSIVFKINFLQDRDNGINLAKNAREKTEKEFSTKIMAKNLSIIFKKYEYIT